MHHTANAPQARGPLQILRQVEAWLDARGRWAWLAAMVAGFVIFVPLGLVILAYMIWGKKMFGNACRRAMRFDRNDLSSSLRGFGGRTTGNQSFDNYRKDTLRRLEEEQHAFESFLQRLRDARDKHEFDTFMDDRARNLRTDASDTTAATDLEATDGPAQKAKP